MEENTERYPGADRASYDDEKHLQECINGTDLARKCDRAGKEHVLGHEYFYPQA